MDLADRFPQPYKGFHYRKSDGAFIISADDIGKAKQIMKNDGFKKLELNPNYFKGSSLDFLSEFDFIENLSVLISDISDLTPVMTLNNLKELTIQHKYKKPIDFSVFQRLEELFLVWGAGADTIFECNNLKNLTIHKYPKTEMLEFGALEELGSLKIVDGEMITLKGLGLLHNLKKLELAYCNELESLNVINSIYGLERFSIENCSRIKSLEELSDNESLKRIDFTIKGSILTISYLETIPNLEEVIFDTNILDGNLDALATLMKKGKLKRAVFKNRKHYTHTSEMLGYVEPPEVTAIFQKKK